MSNEGKFPKEKKITFLDEILMKKKQIGPGSYNTESKHKIKGTYTL